MKSAATACWLVAGLGYLVLEAVAAAGFRGQYDYASNLISDLGRPDLNTSATLMNVAFCLQGSMFLAGAVLASRTQRSHDTAPFVVLAATNALGNVVVGVVHSGSWVHVAGAALAIVGGNAAILAGFPIVDDAGWYRVVSRGLAALGLIALAAFVVAPLGAVERVSVYTIIAWQMISAVRICR